MLPCGNPETTVTATGPIGPIMLVLVDVASNLILDWEDVSSWTMGRACRKALKDTQPCEEVNSNPMH